MSREMLGGLAFLGRELDQLAGCADLREQPQDAARTRTGHVVEAWHDPLSIAPPLRNDPRAPGQRRRSQSLRERRAASAPATPRPVAGYLGRHAGALRRCRFRPDRSAASRLWIRVIRTPSACCRSAKETATGQ